MQRVIRLVKVRSKQRPANQLRIIGGKWRGRKLNFPSIDGLRPTGDRIRETLFNWLAPSLPGAHCLDLYAGSGALSFEALSRGAKTALCLDNQREALAGIRQASQQLQATELHTLHSDAEQFLRQPQSPDHQFDIVFVDPPFAANQLARTVQLLDESELLATNALIYLEFDRRQTIDLPGDWLLLKSKTAGEVNYQLYRATLAAPNTIT